MKLGYILSVLPAVVLGLSISGSKVVGDEVRQGWDKEQRFAMYFASQGSRMIPKAWLDALITEDGTAFASMDHLTSYGLLAPPDGAPSVYPIGMAIDQQDDRKFGFSKLRWYKGQGDRDNSAEPWIGLNCTACHTGSYLEGDDLVIVDGAPSMFDYQSFVEGMDSALFGTLEDEARWSRFADSVLGPRNTSENEDMLAVSVKSLLDWQLKTEAMNETDLRYGFGRVDAVGHILNKVLMFAEAPVSAGNAANAPVSYPFLWNIWRQQKVQWNGSAENVRFNFALGEVETGALGRNTGEVVGVFGDVTFREKRLLDGLRGFASSVNVRNLMRMELLLKKLAPPVWPEAFPEIDKDLAAKGEMIFRDSKCNDCHLTPDMQQDGQPTERMVLFTETSPNDLTDIWMACNAFVYRGPTGPLMGRKDLNGNILEAKAPVFNMLGAAVKSTLLGSKGELIKEVSGSFFGIEQLPDISAAPEIGVHRSAERTVCLTTTGVDILGYKARPLDGIWATAPYLHNGSVASLYELLLPADERLAQFWVGNREFDANKVGYVNANRADGGASLFKVRSEDGTIIEGNSNSGHEYGAGSFSDDDRWAIIEYLKSL